jgi:CelD/BcsL family acetyltransferase involved in cellulose biosynthesis
VTHQVDLLETESALDAATPEWRRLAERAGNPFVSPEWFRSVVPDLGPGWRPAVVAVKRGGALAGVLPFVRRHRRFGGELRLAGAELADILQPAAAPEDEQEVAGAVARALPKLARGLPLRLGRVHADADWWRTLGSTRPGRRVASLGPTDALPYVQLPSNWDEYLAGRSRSFRSQLGRKMRALRKDHEVVIRRSVDRTAVLADLEALFQLHDQRWSQRRGGTAFGPRTRDLHRRLARATAEAGWARLFVMEVDRGPVAAWYGWRLGDRMLYYQAGFDPSWHRHSVGFLLLGETIHGAIDEGCREYDMLLGEEGFKARFADRVREARSVTLARPFSPSLLQAGTRDLVRRAWRHLPPGTRARIDSLRR